MDSDENLNYIKDQKVPVKSNLDIGSFDIKHEEIWISDDKDDFEVEELEPEEDENEVVIIESECEEESERSFP